MSIQGISGFVAKCFEPQNMLKIAVATLVFNAVFGRSASSSQNRSSKDVPAQRTLRVYDANGALLSTCTEKVPYIGFDPKKPRELHETCLYASGRNPLPNGGIEEWEDAAFGTSPQKFDFDDKTADLITSFFGSEAPRGEPFNLSKTHSKESFVDLKKLQQEVGMEDLALRPARPFIGGEQTLQDLETILTIPDSSVIITGPAGSGKSALVQEFARRKKDDPAWKHVRFLSMSTMDLLAGTGIVGAFEEKIQRGLKAVEMAKKQGEEWIVFIDEIHTLIGAGSTHDHNSGSAQNYLKEPLTSGKLRIIGATTTQEYAVVARDRAFASRFYFQNLKQPTPKEIDQRFTAIKENYEKKYGCVYSKEVYNVIVGQASKSFCPARRLEQLAQLIAVRSQQKKAMISVEEARQICNATKEP